MTHPLIQLILVAVVIFFTTACTADELPEIEQKLSTIENTIELTGEPGIDTFQLEKTRIYEDSLFLDQIHDVAVGEDGSLFIAGESWNRQKVFVFEQDGSFRDSLGSYGVEEGQFRSLGGIKLINSSVFTVDNELNRVTEFNLKSGDLLDTTNIDSLLKDYSGDEFQSGFGIELAGLITENLFLIKSKELRNPAYQPEGTVRFSTLDITDENVTANFLFESGDTRYIVGDYAGRPEPLVLDIPEQTLTAISDQGTIYSAETEEFLIYIRDINGEIAYAYYYPYNRRPLDPEELIHPRFSHNEQLIRVWESADYPERWPALYSLLADDEQRIWISTVVEDRKQLEWWVIDDTTGKLLSRFTWPFERRIATVKDGSVYTIEKKSTGFKTVVEYKLSNDGKNEFTQQ